MFRPIITGPYTFPFNCEINIHNWVILVINQLNAQILFYNKFIIFLYMFRALCAHRQEVNAV